MNTVAGSHLPGISVTIAALSRMNYDILDVELILDDEQEVYVIKNITTGEILVTIPY